MKPLDELGISKSPWRVGEDLASYPIQTRNVRSAYNCEIAKFATIEDARLIAAAPDLYECLREAVVEFCHECEDDNIAHCRGKCFVARWRDVLAKAAGESEVR